MTSSTANESLAERVRDFYHANPFPDFSPVKYSFPEDLRRHANPYALLLDQHIPLGARVVDLGCGTGQLSCLLSLKRRSVVGVDFSAASMAKARLLKERLDLKRVRFELSDINGLKPESLGGPFDVILCNGVLPCLPDARSIFAKVCRQLARPGTVIIVGLYHSFGRFIFRLRRWIGAGKPAPLARSIQRMLVKEEDDPAKIRSWIQDQVVPPVEFCYRACEIRDWFLESRIDWIRSLPSLPGDPPAGLSLITGHPAPRPKAWRWAVAEMTWIWTLRNSGGYFVAFGRKAQPK